MLYPKNRDPFQIELFQNPTSEYRGAPFWAWNCKMSKKIIDETIDHLQQMRMGGAHLHCRTGLDTPYLSDEFMSLVYYANQIAKQKNMLTWLYDEDRWPSGYGGGMVTNNDEFRSRFLIFSPYSLDGRPIGKQTYISHAGAVRSGSHTLLGHYAVDLQNGFLKSYRLLKPNETIVSGEKEWFAYLEISGENPWFNNQAYVNTLDKKAIERFVEVTHDNYFRTAGEEFGKSIPAIFTDEPQFSMKKTLRFAEEEAEITLPFTDDLEDTFLGTYGCSLLESLPELFWELPDGRASQIRYQYHDHIAERFASAFADTIGSWCKNHNLILTGHMMEEPTLSSQTSALGEAMRSYRSFGLPGIDMLCDRVELSTAKQAQSAVHQYNREGMMSELYSVTNWDFDFRGHKRQGDWQAALGVSVRVHHHTWSSMAGEAKRDYPASIGCQSPWYREYPLIENYFSRLNTILTRGVPLVRVGVIHPIESFWLLWGSQEQTGEARKEADDNFSNLIDWLLFGSIDFDFIAESLLPSLNKAENSEDKVLTVGAMKYDAILVPNCSTLRKTTLDILEKAVSCGVTVIFAGEIPGLEDALPSGRCAAIAGTSTCVPFARRAILQALEPFRLVEVRDAEGNQTQNIIYNLRLDGDKRWLFFSHVHPASNPDVPTEEKLTFRIRGLWNIELMDSLTGTISELDCEYKYGDTVFYYTLFDHDSLLLCLSPGEKRESLKVNITDKEKKRTHIPLLHRFPVTLEEPNVCLLDMAEYSFDSESWQPREEILRIDNLFRAKLGYPQRMDAFAQPWISTIEEPENHKLTLRFTIMSKIRIKSPRLALENAADITITLNGRTQISKPEGIYVDRAIECILLDDIHVGENILIAEIPYNSKRNVEAMYLLGDFGVYVAGSEIILTEPVKALAFGDITRQGLAFYGGNITYHIEMETHECDLMIQISKFRCPVIGVSIDKSSMGHIALSPYTLTCRNLQAGKHTLDLCVFGNRFNTFGALHNCNEKTQWHGPDSWRTQGESWAYEYQLRPAGILKSPTVLMLEM